jgi:hypothetical protein
MAHLKPPSGANETSAEAAGGKAKPLSDAPGMGPHVQAKSRNLVGKEDLRLPQRRDVSAPKLIVSLLIP